MQNSGQLLNSNMTGNFGNTLNSRNNSTRGSIVRATPSMVVSNDDSTRNHNVLRVSDANTMNSNLNLSRRLGMNTPTTYSIKPSSSPNHNVSPVRNITSQVVNSFAGPHS